TLLAVAAEMRSGGASWDAVAEKVKRRPKTCQRWPARFRPQWEPLYRDAQARRYDEAGNEALFLLRKHMRDLDAKTSLRSIELMLRSGRSACPPPPPEAAGADSPEYQEWLRIQEALD